MSDATGHRDRPNAGPLNSATIVMGGVPTNYYWYHNEATGRYELVKGMPADTRDVVVKEFNNMLELQNWVAGQWPTGGMG
jgi:hypothetical protein